MYVLNIYVREFSRGEHSVLPTIEVFTNYLFSLLIFLRTMFTSNTNDWPDTSSCTNFLP